MWADPMYGGTVFDPIKRKEGVNVPNNLKNEVELSWKDRSGWRGFFILTFKQDFELYSEISIYIQGLSRSNYIRLVAINNTRVVPPSIDDYKDLISGYARSILFRPDHKISIFEGLLHNGRAS